MNVKLIQVNTKTANYDFKGENNTPIPYDVFNTLIGTTTSETDDNLEEVILFKTKDEYLETTSIVDLGIDKEKPVYVGGAGQIFCFRKRAKEENTSVNGTTNTKKD